MSQAGPRLLALAVVSVLALAGAATPALAEPLVSYELSAEGEGGSAVTQAGSHPYQVTGTIDFNQPSGGSPVLARDVVARLPVGLIADIVPFERCKYESFERHFAGEGLPSSEENECHAPTAVGVVTVSVDEPASVGKATFTVPLFN